MRPQPLLNRRATRLIGKMPTLSRTKLRSLLDDQSMPVRMAAYRELEQRKRAKL